jgi:hypothetical protein
MAMPGKGINQPFFEKLKNKDIYENGRHSVSRVSSVMLRTESGLRWLSVPVAFFMQFSFHV